MVATAEKTTDNGWLDPFLATWQTGTGREINVR